MLSENCRASGGVSVAWIWRGCCCGAHLKVVTLEESVRDKTNYGNKPFGAVQHNVVQKIISQSEQYHACFIMRKEKALWWSFPLKDHVKGIDMSCRILLGFMIEVAWQWQDIVLVLAVLLVDHLLLFHNQKIHNRKICVSYLFSL